MRSLPIPLAFAKEYTLRIKDLHIDKLLPVRRQRVTSIAWAADNQMLFYTTEDKVTKRSNQLWKLILGQRRYAGKRKRRALQRGCRLTRSRAYLLPEPQRYREEVRYLPANRPNGRWRRGSQSE